MVPKNSDDDFISLDEFFGHPENARKPAVRTDDDGFLSEFDLNPSPAPAQNQPVFEQPVIQQPVLEQVAEESPVEKPLTDKQLKKQKKQQQRKQKKIARADVSDHESSHQPDSLSAPVSDSFTEQVSEFKFEDEPSPASVQEYQSAPEAGSEAFVQDVQSADMQLEAALADEGPEKESKKKKDSGKPLPLALRIVLIVLEVLLIIVFALYSIMFVLAKGPSETARNLFVKSVRETSAIGFLADIFFSDEEIAEIESSGLTEMVIEMDTSLVKIREQLHDGGADAWGLVDDDGDGIVLEEVHGNTFNGYMMVVYDPSRVIMGCDPEHFDVYGYTVENMVKHFDAVGGVNGGGFVDLNGTGDGSTPSTPTVYMGQKYYCYGSEISGFVGLDGNHILHVDVATRDDLDKMDIRYGCAYGPVLVVNGEIHIGESWESGLNPRTAIGQRSDGAILLLVIDGRHVASLGASFEDIAEVMIKYGAVNACNMDGGSSALMYYNGNYVNNKAFVIGVRPVPTSWIVLKDGVQNEYY